MSVTLDPADFLCFKRPFTEVVTQRLMITNHNAQPIAFKVKTSAPLRYLVRPNKGRVEAFQSIEVSVFLQPMESESPPNVACADKFLIQSTFITADREGLSMTDIWFTPVSTPDHEVHGQKLRVAYFPSDRDVYPAVRKPTYEKLETKYKEALLEIERLKAQILDEGKSLDANVRAVYIRPWAGSQGH